MFKGRIVKTIIKKILNMRLQNFLFCLLLISGAFTACHSSAQQSTNLSINDFEKGVKKTNVQVLDVRTAGEYETGHLKNAVLADWTNQGEFVKKVQTLDKSKPVYTYCWVGGRSAAAAKWLTTKGYKVYNMDGGIAAWKKAGKPIE
jgi:rhodanese-related sulfurtransferase